MTDAPDRVPVPPQAPQPLQPPQPLQWVPPQEAYAPYPQPQPQAPTEQQPLQPQPPEQYPPEQYPPQQPWAPAPQQLPPPDWRQQYPPQYGQPYPQYPQQHAPYAPDQYAPYAPYAQYPQPQYAPYAPYVRAPKPPRKWLGAWGGLWIALGAVGIVGLEFLVAWLLRDVQRPSPREYDVLDPILMLVGSGCVIAGFLYTMAYRVPARWGLSLGRLLGGGLLAGFFAAALAGMVNGVIDALAGGTAAAPSTLSFVLVGFVEESCKLGAALLLGRSLPVKNGRVGLFLGGAVGFGFAAVENLGYLQTAWSVGLAHGDPLGSTLGTAIARQLMGPLLHPVLTGLATAAVFAVARGGRYRLTLGVVGAWLASAVAHSLFDLGTSAAGGFDDQYLGVAVTLLAMGAYFVVAFLAWLLVGHGLKKRDVARAAAVEAAAVFPAPPAPR